MRIDIVSVFPEYFDMFNLSLLGKAQNKGLLDIAVHNLRDWTHDVHHSVDDTPVGGGAGMVMKPEVWANCLDEILHIAPIEDIQKISTNSADAETTPDAKSPKNLHPSTVLIFPNPSAPQFTQKDAEELSSAQHLIFGCGRYEGYDARVPQYYAMQNFDVREYSIGDYVLNGGEVAVSVMVEAITRLTDGFMGNSHSIVEESYSGSQGLLEHRQYTKPAQWRGIDVPEILLSGNHAKVNRFRRDEALRRTHDIRPDIIARLNTSELDKADKALLEELGWDLSSDTPRLN